MCACIPASCVHVICSSVVSCWLPRAGVFPRKVCGSRKNLWRGRQWVKAEVGRKAGIFSTAFLLKEPFLAAVKGSSSREQPKPCPLLHLCQSLSLTHVACSYTNATCCRKRCIAQTYLHVCSRAAKLAPESHLQTSLKI